MGTFGLRDLFGLGKTPDGVNAFNQLSSVCSSSADHLVVMVHGINGSATDWKFASEQFIRMLPDKVVVHCSERNVSTLTLDGVDVMGKRLAEEIAEVIQQKPHLRKISFVAHSLGGLASRYAIARLYHPPISVQDANSRGTIHGLEAMNFITFATPHLGSRGNNQVPLALGVSLFEGALSVYSNLAHGRTGMHLFLTDNEEGGLPLLQRMVTDCDGLYFISALQAFRRRVAYANVAYDRWSTASIRYNHKLPKFQDSVGERYPHIVHEEVVNEGGMTERKSPLFWDDGSDILEEKMVYGLTQVSWERVDVSFHACSWRKRLSAHTLIMVHDPTVDSEGISCIRHMIDHFHC